MTSADSTAFGRRVAFYRKRRGYSQRELAGMIDRSETRGIRC